MGNVVCETQRPPDSCLFEAFLKLVSIRGLSWTRLQHGGLRATHELRQEAGSQKAVQNAGKCRQDRTSGKSTRHFETTTLVSLLRFVCSHKNGSSSSAEKPSFGQNPGPSGSSTRDEASQPQKQDDQNGSKKRAFSEVELEEERTNGLGGSSSVRPDNDDDDDEEEAFNESDAPDDPFPVSHEVILKDHDKVVSAFAIDSAGARIATASHDFDVKLWDFGGMDSRMKPFKSFEPAGNYQVRGRLLN